MSVHERATKSDERTTTNGEDILGSQESADEKRGGRRFHTGVMLFADKIRGKGRRGFFCSCGLAAREPQHARAIAFDHLSQADELALFVCCLSH